MDSGGWLPMKKGSGHGGGILTVLVASLERDPFDAGVVCHVLSGFRDAATFELPAAGDIVHIIEGFAAESQSQGHTKLPFLGAESALNRP
jgi:hypothetical protein